MPNPALTLARMATVLVSSRQCIPALHCAVIGHKHTAYYLSNSSNVQRESQVSAQEDMYYAGLGA